jgi:hypothetical protein
LTRSAGFDSLQTAALAAARRRFFGARGARQPFFTSSFAAAVQPAQRGAQAGIQGLAVEVAGQPGQQAVAAGGVVVVEALEQRQDGSQQAFVLAQRLADFALDRDLFENFLNGQAER